MKIRAPEVGRTNHPSCYLLDSRLPGSFFTVNENKWPSISTEAEKKTRHPNFVLP